MAVASVRASAGTHTRAGPSKGPAHRMAVAAVRLRVGIVAVVLLAVAWAMVSLVGQPQGFYTREELPYVSGLPIAPPQIQRRIAPPCPEAAKRERAGCPAAGPAGCRPELTARSAPAESDRRVATTVPLSEVSAR